MTLPVAVTMTVFAAPVHADGDDATFLAMLNQRGITYNSADQAVTAGKSVCQLLDSGKSDADVLKEVESRNPGIHDLNKAFAFMAVSSDNYCPKYLGTGGAKSEDS
ncbi:MAG: DUF732 domain-containing protein [Chloroflexi bacterium]|nr:DUF732 domain-containing protein [Chloroflexota bacterium]MBV9545966.1 DUF732 domain-containing protein [Chloroflexota bacterium]